MPVRLRIDLIENSLLDNSFEMARVVRAGRVENLDCLPLDAANYRYDPMALIKALYSAGMPQLGEKHPSIANCFVARQIFRGRSGNSADFEIVYETPRSSGTQNASAFYIEDDTGLQSEQTWLGPNGGISIVFYTPETSGATTIRKPVPVDRLTPLRTLRVVGILEGRRLQRGRPSGDILAAVGTVNDRAWQGMGKGFWLCTGAKSSAGVRSSNNDTIKTYNLEATFTSKLYKDWSSYGYYEDAIGDVPQPMLSDANLNKVRNAVGKPYQVGQLDIANGFVKFGAYGMANFHSIFGL